MGEQPMTEQSPAVLTRAMTEEELLTAITEAATFLGWRWHHVRRSDKALQQGHSGFPDLVLARSGHVLFLELKSEAGRLTPDQDAWLIELGPGLRDRGGAIMVKPSGLDGLLDMLR